MIFAEHVCEKPVCKKQKNRFIYSLGFDLSQDVSAGVNPPPHDWKNKRDFIIN